MKRGKKKLNTTLERHMVGPYAFLREVFAFIVKRSYYDLLSNSKNC